MNSVRIVVAFLVALIWFAATGGSVQAQGLNFELLMDAPGPGYRDMTGDLRPETAVFVPTQAVLSFQPKDVTAVKLGPADNGMSQIQLSFQPEAVKQIKEYIEFNKGRKIRVEVGDYTLPLDLKKTLPWTGGLWLEARPTGKVTTILETLRK